MSTNDVRVGRVRLDVIVYHRHNVRTDLGDLRDLVASIKRFGVMQPVVLERRGERLRIRAGHRRVAAARLAGLTRIPAIVHTDALDDDEWLTAAVHENTRRRDLNDADRARTVEAMRAEGMTWEAIADAFGVTETTARRYLKGQNSGPTGAQERAASEDERWDARRREVAALDREGHSAEQIGTRLGLSARQVVRYRTGNRSLSVSNLRTLAAVARERVAAGQWSADDILDALDVLAETRNVSEALGVTVDELAARGARKALAS